MTYLICNHPQYGLVIRKGDATGLPVTGTYQNYNTALETLRVKRGPSNPQRRRLLKQVLEALQNA